MQQVNHNSLCVLIRDEAVLLTMTADRPRKITWSAIASQITAQDSLAQKAVKEIYRLTKLTIYERDLKQAGTIHYFTIDNNHTRSETLTTTIFVCHEWQGEAINATGIRPTWFPFDQIPFNDMFDDAQSWLPKILSGDRIIVEVYTKLDPTTGNETLQDVLIRSIL